MYELEEEPEVPRAGEGLSTKCMEDLVLCGWKWDAEVLLDSQYGEH